jgi:hypothetical protein
MIDLKNLILISFLFDLIKIFFVLVVSRIIIPAVLVVVSVITVKKDTGRVDSLRNLMIYVNVISYRTYHFYPFH